MRVAITRRPEIADPEGTTVMRALHDLGYREVEGVRFDRAIVLEIDGASRERVEEMCARLLVNPVLENYEIEFES